MKRKVLYICGQEMLLDRRDGGKKCSYRNYKMLCEVYGEENVFAYIFTDMSSECNEYIHREKGHKSIIHKIINVALLHPFYSPKQEKRLIEYIKNEKFNLVFMERSMFGTLAKSLKNAKISTQVFLHNIEKNYVWNKVKKNLMFILPYISTKYNERMTFKYVDEIICLTKRDSKLLKEIYHRECSAIIPMTFSDEFSEEKLKKAKKDSEKKLLFIGSCFPPNYDGIKWFIENVMPKLQEYKLYVVGKDFEKKRSELQRENVEIIGTVDTLENYYYSNSVMVMPIRYGDGMKVKTAEALMYGKIIVGSEETFVGYDIQGINGIYECECIEDYVKTIRNILKSSEYVGYSQDVRNKFVNTYSNKNAVSIYTNKFLNLL